MCTVASTHLLIVGVQLRMVVDHWPRRQPLCRVQQVNIRNQLQRAVDIQRPGGADRAANGKLAGRPGRRQAGRAAVMAACGRAGARIRRAQNTHLALNDRDMAAGGPPAAAAPPQLAHSASPRAGGPPGAALQTADQTGRDARASGRRCARVPRLLSDRGSCSAQGPLQARDRSCAAICSRCAGAWARPRPQPTPPPAHRPCRHLQTTTPPATLQPVSPSSQPCLSAKPCL